MPEFNEKAVQKMYGWENKTTQELYNTEEHEVSTLDIKPMGNRILIREDEKKDTTAGGIIIPDTVRADEHKGTVLAVGPKCVDLKAGMRVYFNKAARYPLVYNGETVLLMKEGDVYSVIGEED